jgi:hypothetical protein
MKFNIFGVDLEINQPQLKNFEEYWEIETDTDDFSMVSKEKYSLEFNGQEIPYRFCLLGSYIESDETEEPVWLMSLRLLPDYNFFNKKGIQKIRKNYCLGEDEKIYAIDVVFEFELPIIDHEQKIFKEHFSKDEEFQEYLLGIAYHCQVVSRIIAFSMDKTVNRIMTTNWDLLETILTGCDPFEKGLERCKNLLNKKEGENNV